MNFSCGCPVYFFEMMPARSALHPMPTYPHVQTESYLTFGQPHSRSHSQSSFSLCGAEVCFRSLLQMRSGCRGRCPHRSDCYGANKKNTVGASSARPSFHIKILLCRGALWASSETTFNGYMVKIMQPYFDI